LVDRACTRIHRPFAPLLITALAIVLGSAVPARAQSYSLAWDPNLDGVTVGYRLYYGTASATYQPPEGIDVGATTSFSVSLLPGQTYYFTVRAYDEGGTLGPPSAEISFTVPHTPTLSALSSTVAAGQPLAFRAENGPANRLDWVALFCPDTRGDSQYVDWLYLSGSKSAPAAGVAAATVSFPAPASATPGAVCNARFFANNVVMRLATSESVTIANPVPTASALSPSTAAVGSAQFTLTVTGSGFVSGSTVRWAGSSRPTTFVSATQLRATISASDVSSMGTRQVSVVNPSPGGGTSNELTFTVGGSTLTAGSSTVTTSGTMSFTVANGPGNRADWIALYCPDSRTDAQYVDWTYLNNTKALPSSGLTSAAVTFPVPPGVQAGAACNARLFSNNSLTRLATSGSITVEASPTQPTITPASLTVAAGGAITVTVANGPGNRFDWVGLYCPATDPHSQYRDWFYLNNLKTAPGVGLSSATITLPAPGSAATCSVRLFANNGSTLLAATPLITVGGTD
jgi:hypothetical protein